MSLKQYKSYKDSGVEWLGEVPEHWKIGKFRHAFIESNEKIKDAVVGQMLSVSGYRGIEIKEYDDENRRRLDKDLIGYRIVRPGQLVVNTMWLNYAGLGVSDFEGHVSPAYRSYWISEKLEKRFLHYLMRSDRYVKGYTKFLTGVRPNSLQMGRDDLMAFPILQPSREEQDVIATFLDQETAKIDTLIAEKQRLIELLKEKRQVVISHAVTKGLNLNAPMKDSGVEWLGEVPEHWNLKKLKYTCNIFPSNIDKKSYDLETAVFLCNYTDVYYNDRITKEIDFMKATASEDQIVKFELKAGDLIITKDSETADDIAIAAYVLNDLPGVVCGYHLSMIRPSRGNNGLYVKRLFDSHYLKSCVAVLANGLTRVGLSQSALDNLVIPLPPQTEQTAIASFLDQETAKIDTLIDEANKGITLLQERRSSLISAAVTGKIDVRHLASQEEL